MITWNPNDKSNNLILNNNNLTAIAKDNGYPAVRTTEFKNKGKWYWELKYENEYNHGMGICSKKFNFNNWLGHTNTERVYMGHKGQWWNNGNSITPTRTILKNGDIVGFMLNMDEKTLQININGIIQPDIIKFNINEVYPVFGKTTQLTYNFPQVTANFGMNAFNIITTNKILWDDLIKKGFKPYDLNNSKWFNRKFLIKQNGNYYSLKSEFYNNTDYGLINELEGKSTLTKENYEKYGFDDLNDLLKNITIDEKTFKPIDKLSNEFDVFMMKEK